MQFILQFPLNYFFFFNFSFRVITGVRLVKQKRIFQLEISQRTLKPYAQVDISETDTWKPSKFVDIEESIQNIDYFALSYENRSINLDSVELQPTKVVTGVRFSHHNGHIALQVHSTEFDFPTGRLHPEKSEWMTHDNNFRGSHEIILINRSSPLRKLDENVVFTALTGAHGYMKFKPTDLESDLGQTTIPIIETQQLEPTNLAALSGIGLVLKNYETVTSYKDGTGGIIAPKLIAYKTPIGDPIFN